MSPIEIAAQKLYERLNDSNLSIGHDEKETLYVYLKKKKVARIPKEFEGFKIERFYTGPIHPCNID